MCKICTRRNVQKLRMNEPQEPYRTKGGATSPPQPADVADRIVAQAREETGLYGSDAAWQRLAAIIRRLLSSEKPAP